MPGEDVKLKYGSTGFEKIRGELSQIEKVSGDAGKWFRPMKQSIEEVSESGTSHFSKMSLVQENRSVGS